MRSKVKTVLAPNAPWPNKPVEKPKPVAKKRVPPPPKNPSKIAHTDKKFDEWADRNLARKFK
jgi:hypothetical protein